MSRKHTWKMRVATLLVGGSLAALGGGCIPNNFWATQVDNTLTSVVDAVVGSTILSAINTALGS